MFTQVSMAGTGILVTSLVALFNVLGIEVLETELQAGIEGLLLFVGVVSAIYGQLRRKDLSYGLFRK